MNPIPKELKSDHLFLVMGENPLPNYIAALLLTRSQSAVYLLHSEGEKRAQKPPLLSTQQFAGFIEAALKIHKPGLRVFPYGMSEVNSREIKARVREIIEQGQISGAVGFNYTGARKPMAVHTYLELLQHEKKFDKLVFSYLDANRLAMFFDGISTYPVADEVEIKLQTLAALHGYEITAISQTPKSLPLARILQATLHHKPALDAWQHWIRRTQCAQLPKRQDYPDLAETLDELDRMFGGTVTSSILAKEIGFDELKSCKNWFEGTWLEEIVLDAIQISAARADIAIHDYGISIKPQPIPSLQLAHPKNFELDAAAVIGYRLFAISCIASTKEGGETKKHLFEIFTRARQLGGEEARVALVCLVDDPSVLEDEIQRDWHTGSQIRVFGYDELKNLPAHFYDWFKNA